MSLTQDKVVPQNPGMLQSELSYVKAQLGLHSHSQWKEIAKNTGVPFRTVKRVGYGETEYPRSDTIGKLALYFKTRAKRKAA